MTKSFRHKRNKQRLMQSSFRAYQICRDRDLLGLVMYKRIGLMGHMAVGLMVVTSRIGMTRLKMASS